MIYIIFIFDLCSGGLLWAAMTKTGPNNASHVVWALGMYYFFFVFFKYINFGSQKSYNYGHPMMTTAAASQRRRGRGVGVLGLKR